MCEKLLEDQNFISAALFLAVPMRSKTKQLTTLEAILVANRIGDVDDNDFSLG